MSWWRILHPMTGWRPAQHREHIMIDYRDNCWFLSADGLGAEMGFWTLASAMSFATNNLRIPVKLTNRAIVRKVQDKWTAA
jgi:hypothetical protein